MTAREFVERLEANGARSRRNREGDYHVQCPAHDDRTPSLHVTDRDGHTLLKCQAGCQTQAVLDGTGLDWSALFHDERNGQSEIVDTYAYTDPDGRLIFEAVRLWPKGFFQRQPNGAGGWINSITRPRCTRWLYRMQRVLEAIERRQPLLICEGEKDVHALERLGLYATTNPMGAGKWREEHSRMLIGAADVSVIRDRDDEGRKHAAAVVASLRRVGIEPTLWEPREGKDVSEHLARGHSWMALVEVDVEEAPEPQADGEAVATGEPPRTAADTEGRPCEHKFGTRGIDLTQLRPVRFAWRPYLICGRMNLFAGESAIGKSALQRWLAAQLTRGLLPGELHGQRAKVLWVSADEDDWYEVVAPGLYALGADLSLVREFVPLADSAIFNVVDHIAELDRELREGGYALVVFEHLMDVLPRMRNSTDPLEVRHVLQPLRRVLKAREVTGLGTLHLNKAQAQQFRQRLQGSVQFGALARSSILVVATRHDPERRVAVLGEANYTAEPAAISFRIDGAKFDLNGQGFDVPRVADVTADEVSLEDVLAGPPTDRREVRNDVEDALLAYLREQGARCKSLGNAPLPPAPESRFTVADLARAVGRDPKDGTVRNALDSLAARGLIDRDENKRWGLPLSLFDAEGGEE